MEAMLDGLFDSSDFTAHGFCLSWTPGLLTEHVIADAVLALSYFSVCLTLLAFVRRRRDLAFPTMFRMVAVVFGLCGVVHVSDIATIWVPMYILQGVLKALAGLSSLVAAIGLWLLLPKALALPSPSALTAINHRLEAEIAERRQAEQAM